MQTFTTPMMKQYLNIRKRYPDCLLFYRTGDFYELFLEDAQIGAHVLGITLTSRPEGKDGRIPMAGVPYHAVDSYLAKLVKAGFKVAICEQLSPPNKRGIVERDVVRIVTPGTLIDEKALDKKQNNYLISVDFDDNFLAICVADLSTGDVSTEQIEYQDFNQSIIDELAKLSPTECILSEKNYTNLDLLKLLKNQNGLNIYKFSDWDKYTQDSYEFLTNHFGIKTLVGFGIEGLPLCQTVSAALVGYLKDTQKDQIPHIKKIIFKNLEGFVSLDKSTLINLELFSTIRDRETKGSLLSVLDQTLTSMGGRMLKSWLLHPLTDSQILNKRYDAIDQLIKKYQKLDKLRQDLTNISDIERTLSRLSVGIGNGRDLINLKVALELVLIIKKSLPEFDSSLLNQFYHQISPKLQKVIDLVESTLVEEPPISLREGGLIKSGVDSQLDNLRQKAGIGREWVLWLEAKEKQRTGINSLKVRFNKVFGFYIEVSKANAELVPKDYFRKQTLVGGERFITPELKKQEEVILYSEEQANNLEYQVFQDLLKKVLVYIEEIKQASSAIAGCDCLTCFAYLSKKRQYIRPKIIYSGEIKIKNGRHPVVETLLDDHLFVPNDVTLNKTDHQLLIITGPNMAGKSVLIRQVALIVLMAQIGCFVPATQAYTTLVDKIFVRSGASDVISLGLSTFMVEMIETAHILNHATKDSLIIMDEIGRGTSTYDGISIAWAVAEYLVTHPKVTPKTLFATHYHELQALEEKYSQKIKNYHLSVKDQGDHRSTEPVFLHTIMRGPSSSSFGVAVAKLAGIPQPIVERAGQILKSLENRNLKTSNGFDLKSAGKDLNNGLIEKLKDLEIDNLTPLQALNFLSDLKRSIDQNN